MNSNSPKWIFCSYIEYRISFTTLCFQKLVKNCWIKIHQILRSKWCNIYIYIYIYIYIQHIYVLYIHIYSYNNILYIYINIYKCINIVDMFLIISLYSVASKIQNAILPGKIWKSNVIVLFFWFTFFMKVINSTLISIHIIKIYPQYSSGIAIVSI